MFVNVSCIIIFLLVTPLYVKKTLIIMHLNITLLYECVSEHNLQDNVFKYVTLMSEYVCEHSL